MFFRAPQTSPAADVSSSNRRKPLSLAISAAIAGAAVGAQANEPTMLEPLLIEFKAEQMSSPRYTRDLLDTPRLITVLPQDLLEEQQVNSLSDALKNVTGISLQAGEGNPPSGDQLKVRGFNARDDININGTRDLGNYFRDPFFVDQIEVVKGPNSSFSGRGSAGGTINFVTKQPSLDEANRIELSAGTDSYFRATADLNQPLDDNSALRVNLMTHSSDIPGRDVVNENRSGAYVAYTWGFRRDTRVTVDYLHIRQNDIPDQGIPFDRETRPDRGAGTGKLPAGINYSNYYGYLDDYRRVDVDQGGITIEHSFNNQVSLRNQTRYSVVSNDSIISSPRIRTTTPGSLDGANAIGDIKARDQRDTGLSNQTDLILNFSTGGISHDMVVGIEVATLKQENKRRPDVGGGSQPVDLYNPDYSNRTRPRIEYDGSVHTFETEELGIYLLNTAAITSQLDLSAGVRYDRVNAKASERGHELDLNGTGGRPSNAPLRKTDEEVSFNLGAVFKPTPTTAVYAAMGTAFEISGTFDRNQVQLAGNATAAVASPDTFFIDPEKTRAYEVGFKWDVNNNLNVSTALFRTDKTNARTPDSGGGPAPVLDGEQRISGFEALIAGRVTDDWRLYSSYTYLDSEVRKSNREFEVGQRLGGTPKHTFNVFTTYDVTPRLQLGAGMQAVASQTSNVQPQSDADTIANNGRLIVSIPGYALFDASARYRLTSNSHVRVNAYNLGDKDYIAYMAEGGAQGIPGKGRHVIGTFRYDF